MPERSDWVAIEEKLAGQEREHARLVKEEIPKVYEIASAAASELGDSEQLLKDRESLFARLMQSLDFECGEVASVQSRLEALEEDIRKNKDIKILQDMGSSNLVGVMKGVCPACHQPVVDSLLAVAEGQSVMSLDDNITFLNDQKRTFMGVLANARRRVQFRERQALAVQEDITSARKLLTNRSYGVSYHLCSG